MLEPQLKKMLNEFIELDAEKKKIKSRLQVIEGKLKEMMPILEEHMATDGVDNIKMNGSTVYTSTTIYAKVLTTREEATQALRTAGLDEYVSENFNLNSVSAYIRELECQDEELPASFEGVIGTSEVTKVKVTKS